MRWIRFCRRIVYRYKKLTGLDEDHWQYSKKTLNTKRTFIFNTTGEMAKQILEVFYPDPKGVSRRLDLDGLAPSNFGQVVSGRGGIW
jgi:hypothetical protein